MQKVDGLTEALHTFDNVINHIVSLPRGPQRWRAAHDMLWRDTSFKNKQIYAEVCHENKQTRESVDKFGIDLRATKEEKADKSIREALNIPVGAYMAIAKSDPDAFKEQSNAKKMFRTFPEYTTREVF